MPEIISPPKLNRQQAADYIGVSKPTLDSWASRGLGPRFYKAGSRVWYLVSELDKWIESRSTNCTSTIN